MSPPREYEEHSLYSNKQLKKLDQDLMMQAMQRLLKSSRLKLVMHPKVGQCMVYVSEAQAKLEIEKFGGLSHNEILVFQKIEESGVKGLFQRDLKSRTGITNPNTIRTIIDKLMRRKLIKDFTSVHTGKKKMDLDLVEVCTKLALKFFEQREKAAREKGTTDHGGSVQEVGDFIKGKGVVSCELTMEEVLQLVSTLEYDGLIESLLKDASMLRPADRTFRLVRQGLAGAFEHFTSLPTSICPVANISFPSQPSLCPLLDYWLRL
ncbi:MAG: hypothetical protein ACPIOQ_25550 [Promethearchaeia archaeon]